MIPHDQGGSAFPNDGRWANDCPEGGMTLRDYFAAAAVQGAIAASVNSAHDPEPGKAAVYAYKIADAMLRERSK